MEELGKFVASLPMPAALAFVSVFAAVVAASWRGISKGRENDPAKDVPAAQVAAVIVDPTALNAATAALHRHTESVDRQIIVMQEMLTTGKDLARTFDHMSIELDQVREEMRIQREVARGRT